jgi:hypothetical protein
METRPGKHLQNFAAGVAIFQSTNFAAGPPNSGRLFFFPR